MSLIVCYNRSTIRTEGSRVYRGGKDEVLYKLRTRKAAP